MRKRATGSTCDRASVEVHLLEVTRHTGPRQSGVGCDTVGAVGQAGDHPHDGRPQRLNGLIDAPEQRGNRGRNGLDPIGPQPIEAVIDA